MMQSEDFGHASDVTNGERARRGLGRILRSEEVPAEPVLGVLPLRRAIPQDVHSLLDYSNGILVAWAGLTSRKRKARVAGTVLGATIVSVSLLTGYSKRAPLTTFAHVITGAATILGSLFTDYRAERGVGRKLARRLMGEGGSQRRGEPAFEPQAGGG